jgi:branched-subunit amino acid ABC-type transport system permease component
MMISAFFAWTLATSYGPAYYEILPLTILFSGSLGGILETVAIRPVSKAPAFSIIVVTIGAGMALKGAAGIILSIEVWELQCVQLLKIR